VSKIDLLDLFIKIWIQDEASAGVESISEKLGNGLKTAAKVGAAAITAASTAVVAFGKSAVEAGSTFDTSMSQVAATMGKTVDEIGDLRDFAMEMGANTAFSASQAADALNYMALAGYDAEESMEALPNVLNLAAAGGMELATASDMVTDAQSALGLTMEESTEMVDKMAAAASSSNTSVSQLGEAILTIGGTAKDLAGGTTELSTALGLLADNGIKGAEGGTHLRNIMLALESPTDTAAAALSNLGVEVFDAEGNMRSLEDVFGDLNTAMEGMTSADKTNIISTIFNKTDISSVNALLATSTDRWDELTAAIEDSSGAAETMAGTQLDNLTGDVTLFKSALEGAQIVLSDQLTPYLREFVEFGTSGITQLSEAFQEGGLSGAMDAFGDVLSDGIGMITSMLPTVVDAGAQLLMSLLEGITSNLPQLATAAIQIVEQLSSSISESLPDLIPTIVEIILQIVETLIDNVDQLVDAAIEIIVALAEGLINALPKLMEKAPIIIAKLVAAIIKNAPKLFDAAVDIINEFGIGILNTFVEIAGKVGTWLYDNVVQPILDKVDDFKDAGKQLLEGLWNGISDKVQWLKTKVTGVVDTIKGWFTGSDGFDEHSPSKWAEKVFQLVMEGGGKGFDAGLPGLMSDVNSVVSSVKNGLDFGTANVDFASSGLGMSSAGIINSVSGATGGSDGSPLTVNLVLPDGTKFASWQLPYLIKAADASGTPIASGQYA
jgi:TP901 family phage tail tape measure protein